MCSSFNPQLRSETVTKYVAFMKENSEKLGEVTQTNETKILLKGWQQNLTSQMNPTGH